MSWFWIFLQNMQVILPPLQPQLHSCCRRFWCHYLSPPAVGAIFILWAPGDDVSVRIFSSHCIPGKKCVLLNWSRSLNGITLIFNRLFSIGWLNNVCCYHVTFCCYLRLTYFIFLGDGGWGYTAGSWLNRRSY
jgi:hypothetical protein